MNIRFQAGTPFNNPWRAAPVSLSAAAGRCSPGNLIMLYEAENHCPGAVWQSPFYAAIGLAREIAATNRAIDNPVYKSSPTGMIYRLTEEPPKSGGREIRVMEGG